MLFEFYEHSVCNFYKFEVVTKQKFDECFDDKYPIPVDKFKEIKSGTFLDLEINDWYLFNSNADNFEILHDFKKKDDLYIKDDIIVGHYISQCMIFGLSNDGSPIIYDNKYFKNLWDKLESNKDDLILKDLKFREEVFVDINKYNDFPGFDDNTNYFWMLTDSSIF